MGAAGVSAYRTSVASVLEAVVVRSATSWSWFGERSDDPPESAVEAMDADTAHHYLVHALGLQLYRDFYCPGGATPSAERVPWDTLARGNRFRGTPFVQALSAANAGRGSSEAGWSLRAHEDDWLVVQREGLAVWARPDEVVGGTGGPGAAVSVRLPKELRRLSPGFYMALGDTGLEAGGPGAGTLVRLYWHLTDQGAEPFVAIVTSALNRAGVAFQLKVVDEPERFDRCDAGVLYLSRGDLPAAGDVIRTVHRDLGAHLRPATPAFTKALGPGLGLAEDPGGGGSFGTNRCELLAEAIVDAHHSGAHAVADRLELVATRFAQAGVDLDVPYLNPGSSDSYDALAP